MDDFRQLSTRDRLTLDEAGKLGSLLLRDERRRRPLYFDGRFLTAADLTRDQQWNLARESDIGRAMGSGIGDGLEVETAGAATVTIQPGYGVTPSGELVAVASAWNVNLLNLEDQQALEVALGISRIPRPSPRSRNGLFLLALRPVEYTAQPIAVYPTSLSGQRSTQDGEIVEAVALTLIPYATDHLGASAGRQRAALARDIFVNQRSTLAPVNALPLAMLSLSNGIINWVDTHLVRRQLTSSRAVDPGFGLVARAIREAHLAQYSDHLRAILTGPASSGVFGAADFFDALPAAGPMPARSLDEAAGSQVYFPPTIAVDIAVIPRDELPGLIEDSLSLPPIDLTLPAEELKGLSVLIAAPVRRDEFERAQAGVPQQAPAVQFRVRRPVEKLQVLLSKTVTSSPKRLELAIARASQSVITSLKATEAARPEQPLFWYIRRRNFPYRPETFSRPVEVITNEGPTETATLAALNAVAVLQPRVTALRARMSLAAQGVMLRALASPGVAADNATLTAGLAAFEALPGQIDSAAAQRVATQLSVRKFGEGILRMQNLDPEFDFVAGGAGARMIASTGRVFELDALAARLPDDKLQDFLSKLGAASSAGDARKFEQEIRVQQEEV